jgi:hypothetical protein
VNKADVQFSARLPTKRAPRLGVYQVDRPIPVDGAPEEAALAHFLGAQDVQRPAFVFLLSFRQAQPSPKTPMQALYSVHPHFTQVGSV